MEKATIVVEDDSPEVQAQHAQCTNPIGQIIPCTVAFKYRDASVFKTTSAKTKWPF